MKKILGVLVVVLSILLIYLGFRDTRVYYLTLGDGLSYGTTPYGGVDYGYSDYIKDYLKEKNKLEIFVNEFSKEDYRTTDLTRDIKDNVETEIDGKNKTIQNALIKADLITLSIGNSELLKNLELSTDFGLNDLVKRFDSYVNDLDELLSLIRRYSKETIVLTGYYNPTSNEELNALFNNLNRNVSNLCNKYNVIFIIPDENFNNYIINKNNIYPSKEGYKNLSEKIIEKIVEIY